MTKKNNAILSLLVFLSALSLSLGAVPGRALTEDVEIDKITEKVYPSVVRVEARNGMRKVATGVVIDKEGYIVTTALISPHDEKLYVITSDGERIDAEFLGMDSVTHLALIQADAKKLTPIAKGEVKDISPGAWIGVISISPDGTPAVTQGIVSSLARDKLRLNVWVVRGASGSPVVNSRGRMVGLIRGAYIDSGMTWSIVQRGEESVFVDRAEAPSSGMALAVPVDVIDRVCTEIRKTGKMKRGWLGVSIAENEAGQVEIVDVEHESPAELAKLEKGDIVLEFEENKVTSTEMLAEEIRMHKPGEDVDIKIERDGKSMNVKVELGEFSEKDIMREFQFKFPRLFAPERVTPVPMPDFEDSKLFRWVGGMQNYIGVSLQELTPELCEHFGVKEGRGLLVAKVLEDSPAEKEGLRVGDVIISADGERIERVNALQRLIQDKDKGEKITIEYVRDKKKKTVEIEVAAEEREFEFSSKNWDKYTDVFRSYSDKLQNQYKESQKKYKEDAEKYFVEAQKNYRKISEEMEKNSKNIAEEMKENSKKVAETYRKSRDKAKELYRSAYERYRCIRV
ncbi:MAG TPA: PDZ domain-containing protein [Candidatus Heimdallarchaeota archaeon]|nr:PDZ domain-containing protein [Candidatus Heimdallarchaeota archaeon]